MLWAVRNFPSDHPLYYHTERFTMTERNSVRAITTRYKGYNFRSRLEARWAVFFDHLKIRWDYEPEGFELGNGLRYLPDFWLPDWKIWVEIKPGDPDDAASEKAWRLVEQSGFMLYMSNGMPDNFGTLFATYQGDWLHRHAYRAIPGWHQVGKPVILVQDETACEEQPCAPIMIRDQIHKSGAMPKVAAMKPPRAPLSGRSNAAVEAARGARFEFGEKGGAA